MRHKFRLGRGARLLPVLGTTLALAAIPSVASASSTGATAPGFDPQTTNVPYLAWNGEQVRLEKCVPADGLTFQEFNEITSITTPAANFAVEDWSGNNTPDPTINTSTEKIFYSFNFDNGNGGLCASSDVVSLNPGIARIELDVSAFTVPDGTVGYFGPAQPFLAHQFLAAWMTLNTPTLSNMKSSDFGADPSGINDPTGTGTEGAGNNPAYLDVKVTGTIPISGAMDNLFGGSPTSITLPNDWVTMAQALATDDNVNNTTAYNDWDTSGTNLDVSGHVPGACDAYPSNPFGVPAETPDSGAYQSPIDNGDNCSGGGPDGAFSLGNGGLSDAGTTIGPFDPVNASSTDLADGDLNSLDAPMPAARVDVAIAQNSGSSSDTSGVGSLQAANKTMTFSRDFQGDSSDSNLYAPFYDAYIPATARPTDDSSGIDGAFVANNFPGFLDISNSGGDYHFWDTLSLDSNSGTPTNCLAYSSDANPQGQHSDEDNTYRNTPSGDYNVALYTDQNGEAQVKYVPGYGYYFDNLGADENADGGCDLESMGNSAISTLGTASIKATAKYPYKSVDYPNMTSNAVTETVSNQFDKSLSYAPKGTSAEDNNARIVISHAQEIDGSPIVGETVCFSADYNAEGVTRFGGYIDGVYYGGSSQVPDPENGLGRLCLTTDQNGNAAIEVDDSNPTTVDVIADYVNEGLLRDIKVDFSTPGSTGGNVPTGPQSTQNPQTTTVGTTAPSAAQVAAVSPGLAAAIHHTIQRRDRITVMRLLMPARGKHYMMLRVRSTHRTARVAMTLRVRSGRHTRTVHRTITVRTNRMIKLVVPRTVTHIRGVHLIG